MAVKWPNDLGVLFRWPAVLDVFPSPNKDCAVSFNALSRLILFGGVTLFYVRRDPMVLAGTSLLMLYLFGEQHKFHESYYNVNKWDVKLEDDVAPKRDVTKESLQQEATTAARRMVENPRDLRGRAAIVSTVDDKIYASRPAPISGDWTGNRFPEYMSGRVGGMKATVRPV